MSNVRGLAARVLSMATAIALLSGCKEPQPGPGAPASVLSVPAVRLEPVEWSQTVEVNGPVKPWQEIIVSPETGGLRIAELRAEVGDRVKRGDLLARLADDSVRAELHKQQAAVARAKAGLDQAQSNYKRAREAADSGALSVQQIEEYKSSEATARASLASARAELESTELKLSQTRIVAVDDGVVASRSGVLGNVVASGSELYRLIRKGTLEWRPELDARQLASIRPRQAVRLNLPDGQQAEGQVRLVGPVLDGNTGRATVYVALAPGSSARQGMFASGTIVHGQSQALTLPQAALTLRDGRSYVWVLDRHDKVTSRAVTTGRRVGSRVEILSGLARDEQAVAAGGAFLSDGATVTVVQAQAETGSSASPSASRSSSEAAK